MERGNYSDAIRRMTTALEVLIETRLRDVLVAQLGDVAAERFIESTKMKFPKRIEKYEELSGRKLPERLKKQFFETRELRHRIVHTGHRITSAERDAIQKSIDLGRWTFNWFENNPERKSAREQQVALRSLGREMPQGIFAAELLPEGIVVRRTPKPSLSSR
jgi:hypothetical protein